MKKKTALEKACEETCSLFYEVGCLSCSADCSLKYMGFLSKNVCIKNLKQHFQQQADIPDGWEIVKEIYKKLNRMARNETCMSDDIEEECRTKIIRQVAFSEAESLVSTYLEQAGIEVE